MQYAFKTTRTLPKLHSIYNYKNYQPWQVGSGLSKEPVVEVPSPPHVNVGEPTNANPSLHSNVHTLSKLLLSVQTGSFPSVGLLTAGQVMAVWRENVDGLCIESVWNFT